MKDSFTRKRKSLVDLCLCISLVWPITGFGQQIPNPYLPVPDYLTFIEEQDSYWEDQIALFGIETLLAEEASPYGHYLRWREHWLPRLQSSSGMAGYQANLDYLYENPLPILPNSGIWHELGPVDFPATGQNGQGGRGIGPVNFVTLAPDFETSHLMFTGGWNCGLFYSEDAGLTWKAASDFLGANISSSDCKASHLDHDVWFMADGNGDGFFDNGPQSGSVRSRGVYRTLDKGETWELVCDAVEDLNASVWEFQIKRVLIDPTSNAENMVVYITTSKGIFRTTNAMDDAENVEWELVLGVTDADDSNLPANHFISDFWAYDLIFIPQPVANCNDCGKMVASVSKLYLLNGTTKSGTPCNGGSINYNGIPDIDIYISDGTNSISRGHENNWDNIELEVQLEEYFRASLDYSPDTPEKFYLYVSRCANDNSDVGIFSYNLPLEEFIQQTASGLNFWSNYGSMMSGDAFTVSPTNADNMFVISGIRIEGSTNGGQTFSSTTGNYHDDIEDLIFTPDGNTMYAATHGGIFLHTLSPNAWEPRCTGLGVAEIEGLSSPMSKEDGLNIGCFHDNSMMSIDPFTEGWTPLWKQTLTAD
jgi:hypothetical protein